MWSHDPLAGLLDVRAGTDDELRLAKRILEVILAEDASLLEAAARSLERLSCDPGDRSPLLQAASDLLDARGAVHASEAISIVDDDGSRILESLLHDPAGPKDLTEISDATGLSPLRAAFKLSRLGVYGLVGMSRQTTNGASRPQWFITPDGRRWQRVHNLD